MKLSRTLLIGAAAFGASLTPVAASAQDYYAAFSVGAVDLDDSDNSGAFSSDFTTGEGTTIPAGVVLPEGTPVGWTTAFDDGSSLSAALGRRFGAWRGEIELSRQSNDVETHSGVEAGGIPLDGEDAGVLITGSPNLGVSVGDLVDDGQGSVETTFLFANGFYDFNTGGPITPYIGAGIGVGMVDVDYSPSGVEIVNDDATVFAYQLIGGAAFDVTERIALFAQARYRATEDVETEVALFDANLDIENRATLIEAGVRFRF
jgi:opacity protein-like surface antigen